MKIAVCDDEIMVADQLRRIICRTLPEENEVSIYLSGKSLLEEADAYDIIFLDLKMPGMDGLETGKRIRKINPKCKIIVASGELHRMKEGYYLNALRFVTKPFDEEEIAEALWEAGHQCLGEQKVEVYDANMCYHIRQKDICYMEAFDGYVRIFTGDHMYRRDIRLEQMKQQLDPRLFVQISRGTVVNLFFAERYQKGTIVIHGKVFHVARRRKMEIQDAYVNFVLKYKEIMRIR